MIEASQSCTNRIDARPCPLCYCQETWELAQRMNDAAPEKTQKYWCWCMMYIRAYLDLVRYTKYAERGWPLLKGKRGWFSFWRPFLEYDRQAQDFLLERIHLYKA